MSVPPPNRKLRILHLILVLRSTNSQYNEHSLPVAQERDISLCTYFTPQLTPPPEIAVYAGNDTLRGFFRAMREALDAGEYDAIHAHSPQAGLLFLMGLLRWRRFRALRPISVYTVHDSFYDYKVRNKLLMLPSLALFQVVVFCSHAAFDSFPRLLKRLVGKRKRVVQNGADIARVDRAIGGVSRSEGRPFTVLSVGRIERVKDPLAVLAAFDQGGGEEGRLVYVGEGSLRPELTAKIAAAGLGGRVSLTGLIDRDEVFHRFVESDVFVSTSHGEGLPVAAMEAMACGRPVILSDIPPHRELTEGIDFIPLIAPGDIDGFAREIARVRAMSAEERAELGRRCRRLVESRFSLPRMLAGYERVYRELAPAGRSGGKP